jgi:amidase
MRQLGGLIALAMLGGCGGRDMPPAAPSDAPAALRSGLSSERLTRLYLERIEALDARGPTLRSVIAVSPDAVDQAQARDRAGAGGPLHGLPILIKDNIDVAGPLPTTAGSLALKDNVTGRDAPVVARLRTAGAVILGKTNLSEWANIRSNDSISGWSAVGGQVRNPHALDRNACGSSSGSGAAVAAGLAAAAIGTETDGSITCPASVNGIVGLKPTVGLVSRRHIVPISESQDTAGPMTVSVRDAALVLTAIAGSDPGDPATAEADARKQDYAAGLDAATLRGRRIGVMRFGAGFDAEVDALFDATIAKMKAAGAEVVEIPAFPGDRRAIGLDERLVLYTELKAGLAAYLASTGPNVGPRTLADLIAFNSANAAKEMPLFGQETFLAAEATKGLDDPAYRTAKARAKKAAGPDGIDRMLREAKVEALIAPTTGPAWFIDPVNGDQYSGGGAGSLAAVAGYPHLTVPMGDIRGLPLGLSIIGPAWSEARLLAIGAAFERIAPPRLIPTFRPTVEGGRAFEPQR